MPKIHDGKSALSKALRVSGKWSSCNMLFFVTLYIGCICFVIEYAKPTKSNIRFFLPMRIESEVVIGENLGMVVASAS